MTHRIILAGASGMIGGEVAKLSASRGHELHIIARRAVEGLPASVHQHIADTEMWPDIVRGVQASIAISCIGTTMRTAGSKQAFAAVDLDLVLAFAAAARSGKAQQMIAVSSVGASKTSSNFYLQTKGKVEASLRLAGFDRTDIMRPGLLRGKRGGQVRAGEQIGILISPITDFILRGPFTRYRSIAAVDVAAAITALVGKDQNGAFIHENDAIAALAG